MIVSFTTTDSSQTRGLTLWRICDLFALPTIEAFSSVKTKTSFQITLRGLILLAMGEINDSKDLATFGYQQQLDRGLGSFSVFAAGFSYISILTGMFQIFYLGYGAAGPAFFWSWPLVLCGQILIALCFAELAARYPLSGGVYQWAKFLSNPTGGWLVGCLYLMCLIATLAAVALALQNTLPRIAPIFHFVGNKESPEDVAANAVVLGGVLILISTIVNAFGVRLLALLNNVGVFSEIVGVLLLILLLAVHSVRSPLAAVFETLDKGKGWNYLNPFLAACAVAPAYVLYGFDTAGTLAEETQNPRRRAPRAILQALFAAGLAGLFLLLFALAATPDLHSSGLSLQNGGLSQIVEDVLGPWSKIFLWDVILAILVCVMAVHSGIVRLIFALARDGHGTWSKTLSAVSEKTRTPILPTVLSGTAALLVLAVNFHYPKIVELVTCLSAFWANLAYFIVAVLLLRERIKNKNSSNAPEFTLGRFGLPINVLAVLWGAFMVLNVGWPRTQIYGDGPYQFALLWLTAGCLGLAYLLCPFKALTERSWPPKRETI